MPGLDKVTLKSWKEEAQYFVSLRTLDLNSIVDHFKNKPTSLS